MPVEIWCELVCAHCSVTICGQYSTQSRLPRRELVTEAKKHGAVVNGSEIFCCKNHLACHLEALAKGE